MSNFKPLLAAEADLEIIDWDNCWVSVKLDGIRAIVIDGVVMSRSLKPIPNKFVQSVFGHQKFNGMDGELLVGPWNSPTVYHDTFSGVMKAEGEPEVTFALFDNVLMPQAEYQERHASLSAWQTLHESIIVVPQTGVVGPNHLSEFESGVLDDGYEGVMLRNFRGPKSLYKFGRSTAKEGTLLKLKRFSDKEATIIGVEEEMQNNNEATTDELGHTKRSSHQENKVGKGRLGALVCRIDIGLTTEVEFRIGTGYTAKQRQDLWDMRDKLLGKLVKFKSFDVGVKDAPRFPVFLGLRDEIDM